jgi:hypothetical protein
MWRCTRDAMHNVAFPAIVSLALFAPGLLAAQDVKEIKLTEKQIQGFIAAHEAMTKLYAASQGRPDPKVEAQADAVARKNGFANLAEHHIVTMNIVMILSGVDPQTKTFTEPPEQIKKEIAMLKADKSVSERQKKEILTQLEAALKEVKPIQYKENIALVVKYLDKLPRLMQEEGPAH